MTTFSKNIAKFSKEKWSLAGKLVYGRYNHQAIYIDHQILIIGGSDSENAGVINWSDGLQAEAWAPDFSYGKPVGMAMQERAYILFPVDEGFCDQW